MKIDRRELSPTPSAADLGTLALLQAAQHDRENRLATLAEGMSKVTTASWADLRDLLTTTGGVTPSLPAVPLLSFFYGDEPTMSTYFCSGEPSFRRYPIAAPGILGLALSSGDTWLLQLDLETEKQLSVSCTSGYHQRLLATVTTIIFGRQKEAVRVLAEEFYLLASIDQLVEHYSRALAGVALDKVKHDANAKAEHDRSAEHLSWDDLILPVETKSDLQTYCEILRRHDYYHEQGVTIPKGLLLIGLPGVGKTQIARVLSREAGFHFINCSTATLKVGFIGHSANKVQEIFTQAREHSPSLIFIDELDSVAPPRGQFNDCIAQELTAQLLTEIDGVASGGNGKAVFVVAASNRIDMIDSALLSRFTEHITIGLPSPEDRMALLRLFVGKTPLYTNGSSEIELLARLSLATENKSGRDLKNMVDRARMKAIKRSLKTEAQSVTLEEGDFRLVA